MESHIATYVPSVRAYRTVRARVIASLGPLTSLGGVLWAFGQPYRITLLHPHGQGVWWLVAEPPLLVVAVGIAFAVFVAKPLIADLEGDRAAA